MIDENSAMLVSPASSVSRRVAASSSGCAALCAPAGSALKRALRVVGTTPG